MISLDVADNPTTIPSLTIGATASLNDRSPSTFSRAPDYEYSAPVVIANDPERDYSDTDVVRLGDGRFLAVVREHVTLQSVYSHSEDEGRTWSPVRPTDFKGSNIKLWSLRSGAVACAYRDEDPSRRGVSLSVTHDGGENWELLGQLYDGGDGRLKLRASC